MKAGRPKQRPRRIQPSNVEGMVAVYVSNDGGETWEFDKLKRAPKALARKVELQGSGERSARRKRISPASNEQRAAVDGLVCLGCGKPASDYRTIDPAHLWPRGRGGCDDALCVVPLCRTFDGGCHRRFDEATSDDRLDLLRIIAQPDKWEQWRAHAQHALEHCTPNELVERLTGQRTQWSDAA